MKQIANLKVGKINTKELVELFGTKAHRDYYKKHKKVPNSMKNTLLNRASAYCDIESYGSGDYRINRLHEVPYPLSFSKANQGIYQFMSPLILLKLLSGDRVTFPLIDWAMYIDMVNKNYKPMKFNKNLTSNSLSVPSEIVGEFFEKIDDSIRYYMENCLEYLRMCDVLVWYKVPTVRKRVVERVNVDGSSDINLKCGYTDQLATEEEVKFINKCSDESRIELDIVNKRECFYGSKSEAYCKLLSDKLKQQDILYHYDSYQVYYTSLERCKNLLSLFKYDDVPSLVRNFNNEFIKYMINCAQKRYDTAIAKNLSKLHRQTHQYIMGFDTLSNITIDKDSEVDMYKELDVKNNPKSQEKFFNDFNVNIIK